MDKSLPHYEERPKQLQLQISQAIITNCRVGLNCSQAELLDDLPNFIGNRHYADMTSFPNKLEDLSPQSNQAWLNDYSVNHHQLQNLTKRDSSLIDRLIVDGNLPKEVWCVWCDQVWLEFIGIEKADGRPVMFVDAVPIRLWISQNVPYTRLAGEITSPRSVGSVEVAECASEADSDDSSSAASDSGTTLLSKTSFSNLQRTASNASSKNLPLKRHSRNPSTSSNISLSSESLNRDASRSNSGTASLSNLYVPNANNIHELPGLRLSHSETDLLGTGLSTTVQSPDTVSLKDFRDENGGNISNIQDVPPPPYSSSNTNSSISNSNVLSSSSSIVSLPPAYETLAQSTEAEELPSKLALDTSFNGVERNTASVALLLNVSKPVSIQLGHFRLLFLLRLQESFEMMGKQIKIDTEEASMLSPTSPDVQKDSSSDSMILNINIPSATLDLVLHPCIGIDSIQKYSMKERIAMEKTEPGMLDPNTISENVVTDIPVPLRVIPETNSTCDKKIDSSHLNPKVTAIAVSDTSDSIPVSDTSLDFLVSENSNKDSISKASMPDTVPSNLSSDIILTEEKTNSPLRTEEGGESLLIEKISSTLEQSEVVEKQDLFEKEDLGVANPAFSQVNQSSSTSGDTADISHSSITDESLSDDDCTPELNDLTCFTDVSTLTEENATSKKDLSIQVGESATHKVRPEDTIVSIVRLKVSPVSVGINTMDDSSYIKVSAGTITLKELGNMKYINVIDPRGSTLVEANTSSTSKESVNANALNGDSMLKLRLVTGPKAETLSKGAKDLGFAHIKIHSLVASLLMSTTDNLAEFGEDEFVMPTPPFFIELSNSNIRLYDDKSRRYLSAIKPPPMSLTINNLTVSRNIEGAISLNSDSHPTGSTPVFPDETLTTIDDSGHGSSSDSAMEPRRRGSTMKVDKNADEVVNRQIEAVMFENNRLLEDLRILNARVTGLHSERESLMKVIDKLQQELMWSNRENDDLHQRIRALWTNQRP